MRKIQIETQAMQAHELCALIEASPMYNSGRRFSAEEIMRSMNRFKLLGTPRVKLLLNRMADECKLNKVRETHDSHEVVFYVKRESSRSIITRRWCDFVTNEYTPRYY